MKLDDMSERELIEFAQKRIGETRDALRRIRRINEEAGRADAAIAAYEALSELGAWHARASRQLMALWPDFASEIVLLGPGGR